MFGADRQTQQFGFLAAELAGAAHTEIMDVFMASHT
jgi:hypothetical protein